MHLIIQFPYTPEYTVVAQIPKSYQTHQHVKNTIFLIIMSDDIDDDVNDNDEHAVGVEQVGWWCGELTAA